MVDGTGPGVRHEDEMRPRMIRRVGRGTVTVLRYPWQLVIGAILGRSIAGDVPVDRLRKRLLPVWNGLR